MSITTDFQTVRMDITEGIVENAATVSEGNKRKRDESDKEESFPVAKVARVAQECFLHSLVPELCCWVMKFLPIEEQVKLILFRLWSANFDDMASVALGQRRILEYFRWSSSHDVIPLMHALNSCTIKWNKHSLLWTMGICNKKDILLLTIKSHSVKAFRCLMEDFAKYGFLECLYYVSKGDNLKDTILMKALYSGNKDIEQMTRNYMPIEIKKRFFS